MLELIAGLSAALFAIGAAADQDQTALAHPHAQRSAAFQVAETPADRLPDRCVKDHSGLALAPVLSAEEAHARLAAALADGGEITIAEIDGLECPYCAAALEKDLLDRREIEAAVVDLRAQTISFVTKPGASIDDSLLRKYLKRQGHHALSIRRAGSMAAVSEEVSAPPAER